MEKILIATTWNDNVDFYVNSVKQVLKDSERLGENKFEVDSVENPDDFLKYFGENAGNVRLLIMESKFPRSHKESADLLGRLKDNGSNPEYTLLMTSDIHETTDNKSLTQLYNDVLKKPEDLGYDRLKKSIEPYLMS